MKDAAPLRPEAPAELPFNVRPCLRDPVMGLLKDRWALRPVAGAGLFLGLYLGGMFLAGCLGGVAWPRDGLDRAFLTDRAHLLLYGIVVPAGALLVFRFYYQVELTFERLRAEGVVSAPMGRYNEFLTDLHRRYNSAGVHWTMMLLALALCSIVTWDEAHDGIRAWLDLGQGPAGYVHFLLLGPLWYTVLLFVAKAVITAQAMQQVFELDVRIQPLHPDGCGGMRHLSDISVTIALFVALAGFAVVLLVGAGAKLTSVPVVVAVVLLVLTPLVFLACLLSAHRVMKEARESLLMRLNLQAQGRYDALCERLNEGDVPAEETDELLRLGQLHAFTCRLPVWPTNTQMVVQVLLSVALPLGMLVLQVVIEHAVEK